MPEPVDAAPAVEPSKLATIPSEEEEDTTPISHVVLSAKPSGPKGTLSVSSDGASGVVDTSPAAPSIKIGRRPVIKKQSGVRRLSTNKGVKLESFESLENKAAKAKESAAVDGVSAGLKKLDANDAAGGSTRLAAAYTASESIFRSDGSKASSSPYQAAPSSKSGYSAGTGGSSGRSSYISSGSGRSTSNSSSVPFDASRFTSNKGISSDQYFGVDDSESSRFSGKVQSFSTHNAISSDMIYGSATTAQPQMEEEMSLEEGMTKLKDSVKDFFSSSFN